MKFGIIVFSIACLIALSIAEEAAEHEHEDDHKGGHKPYDRHLDDKDHHEEDDELHNSAFDHQSFLGKDEAEKFDQLSPEESKQRLGDIVDKIDKNGDKKITEQELMEWIRDIAKQSIDVDSKKQFDAILPKTEDGKLTFESYTAQNYGQPDKKDVDSSFKEALDRDQRKWKLADQDGDGNLNLEEFTAFIHPEEAPHMRDIVVEEAMNDMDKDKDGYVSLEEYIRDQWQPKEGETEPDWLKEERETFSKTRDKNGDGRLDSNEISEWLVPKDYDHSLSEAKHLISKSDKDNDGVLTKEEILNNHDLFAGSQATDFGSALNQQHDEL